MKLECIHGIAILASHICQALYMAIIDASMIQYQKDHAF